MRTHLSRDEYLVQWQRRRRNVWIARGATFTIGAIWFSVIGAVCWLLLHL